MGKSGAAQNGASPGKWKGPKPAVSIPGRLVLIHIHLSHNQHLVGLAWVIGLDLGCVNLG